jgi:CheY-like chemotaxis protein
MNVPLARIPSRLTIMAVDDEEAVLSLIVELLEDLGHTPVPASRGDSALALIEQASQLTY